MDKHIYKLMSEYIVRNEIFIPLPVKLKIELKKK